MKIAFLIYHDILEDRIEKILEEQHIDSYTKWENVTGKFQNSDPLLGTRIYPGHETVRLIPFTEEESINNLIMKIEEFNSKAVKVLIRQNVSFLLKK
jgi:hypothetical protein